MRAGRPRSQKYVSLATHVGCGERSEPPRSRPRRFVPQRILRGLERTRQQGFLPDTSYYFLRVQAQSFEEDYLLEQALACRRFGV
jgi:hypothetical protein